MEKLEKYADGENIFNRQMVARTVLETLRQVLEDKSAPSSLNASSESCEAGTSDDSEAASRPGAEVGCVFSVVELLARDTEATVRAELMEQVTVIVYCCYCLLLFFVAGASYRDVLSGAGDPGVPSVRPLWCSPHPPPAACCQVMITCEALSHLNNDNLSTI